MGGITMVSGAVIGVKVEAGRLVGLIGPNGAGKTTFIDAITGFVRSHGAVELAGEDLSRVAPHERARRGLGRTWQAGELFDDLTVAENLAVASERPSMWTTAREVLSCSSPNGSGGREALARVGMEAAAERLPSELSQGERNLVGVARALAASPRVVCLDEPAAGLDTAESEQLGVRLRKVVDGAAGRAAHAAGAGDRRPRLRALPRDVVLHASAAELRADEQLLVASYLGEQRAGR